MKNRMRREFRVVSDLEPLPYPLQPDDYRTRAFLLPLTSESSRTARRCMSDLLLLWSLSDLVDPAALITAELVGNAVRHATGWSDEALPVRLLAIYAARTLRIEVRDPDPRNLPVWRVPEELATFGYGMQLVHGYADRYGVRVTDAGKAVWCEIDRHADAPFSRSDLTTERGGSHG
ncbi:ATP-binding protein [Nonomuraea sp. NPDC059023]|uniref:ATP-binding protein n=1 Tax=unclassified Nonomuraea TaxID=2593643 RepID=UPI0036B7F80E